ASAPPRTSGTTCGPAPPWCRWAPRRSPIRARPRGSSTDWSGPMAEVILALDVPGAAEALRFASLPGLRWVKVGSILFTREGPSLVRELRARGLEVFLDLKWHDIPNTVAGAVERAE